MTRQIEKLNNDGNIFSALPESLPEELEQTLLNSEHISIKRILSKGQSTPESAWYDQGENEWVMVVQGEGILEFDNEDDRHLKQGDYCFIPAHKKHRVKWTPADQITIWLALYISADNLIEEVQK